MATMKGFGKWQIHDGGKETTKFLGLWWCAKNYGDGVKKGRSW